MRPPGSTHKQSAGGTGEQRRQTMRHTKKMLKAAALACLLGPLAPPAMAAQGYPDKPITMLVPYPAGQSVALLARVISDGLSTVLGPPIIVENKPGAGGTLGTGLVARAAPDGYPLGMSSQIGSAACRAREWRLVDD